MEFFELGIDRIHKLILMCFTDALERGLIIGLSSCIIGILLVIFLNKFQIFNRRNSVHDLLAKTYYFFIPFTLLTGGIITGGIWATKDFFAKETDTSISPLMKLIFPAYQSYVNTHWSRVIQTNMTFDETLKEYTDEIKFEPRNEGSWESMSTDIANYMVPKITKWGIESTVSSAKEIALKQSEQQGYIEINKVKALLIVHTLSMFNYPLGLWEATNNELKSKIDYFFAGILGNFLIIFSIFFMIPFIETFIYFSTGGKKSVLHETRELHEIGIPEKPALEESLSEKISVEFPKPFEN